MRFLATATAGSYDDPMDDVHPDLIEAYYGVDGRIRVNPHGSTGAGHSDDEEDFDEDTNMGESEEGPGVEDESDSDEEELDAAEDTLDPDSAWEPDVEGDLLQWDGEGSEDEESDGEGNNSFRTVMNQQMPNVRHAAIKVPRVRNPFVSAEHLEAFCGALEDLRAHGVLPVGLNARPEEWESEWGTRGYPTWEPLPVGRARRETPIDLTPSIWVPRAQRWCQAVDMLTRFQRDENGMLSD